MKIKQIILSTICLTTLTIPSFAQATTDVTTPTQINASITEQRIKSLTTRLKLSPDQQVATKTIFDNETTTLQQLQQDKSLSQEQLHVKIQQTRKETKAKLDAIFTPEQKASFNNRQTVQSNIIFADTHIPATTNYMQYMTNLPPTK